MFFICGLMKYEKNCNNRGDRDQNEKQSFVSVRGSRKQTERHPRVADMGDAEVILDHPNGIMQRDMEPNEELGVLIDDDQSVGKY